MLNKYNCILISLLLLVFLNNQPVSSSLSPPNDVTFLLKDDVYDFEKSKPKDGVVGCTFEKSVPSCQTFSGQLFCPTIAGCLDTFNQLNYSSVETIYAIYIPSDSYEVGDCPGQYGNLIFRGQLIFTSIYGPSSFDCLNNQFLDITLSSNLTITFSELELSGQSETDGGCINIIAPLSVAPLCSVNLYNISSGPFGCIANNKGGFLNTDVGMVSVVNSNLTNNVAKTQFGGAIAAQLAQLDIVNSNLSLNSALRFYGGATYSFNVSIYNSIFNNNFATAGGSVYSQGDANVVGSSFSSNLALGSGGAIYTLDLTAYNSVFFNNTAYDGGAIFGNNMTLSYCDFTKNQATGSPYSSGGAIYSYDESGGIVRINYSNFTDNLAIYEGGSILLNSVSILAQYTNWVSNVAQANGGAIGFVNGKLIETITFIWSNFIDNLCYKNGGAINIDENGRFSNLNVILMGTVFDSNSANSLAGGIFFLDYPDIFGGTFINSKSSEPNSMTFYSASLQGVNVFNITNNLPIYEVPTFKEQSFSYWKASGVQGNCNNGIATISQSGQLQSCSCFQPATGPSCN